MCENCHDHKYILIKLDIQSEGIMAWLPKFGLSVKSCPKKKVVTSQSLVTTYKSTPGHLFLGNTFKSALFTSVSTIIHKGAQLQSLFKAPTPLSCFLKFKFPLPFFHFIAFKTYTSPHLTPNSQSNILIHLTWLPSSSNTFTNLNLIYQDIYFQQPTSHI